MLPQALLGMGQQLASPAFSQAMIELRYDLGWSDLARTRNSMYTQNEQSCDSAQNVTSNNFGPMRLNFAQAVQFYNQQPWHLADRNEDLARRFRNSLRISMNENGVNTYTTEPPANATAAMIAAVSWANTNAEKWRRLIDMSAQAAPLEQVIHDHLRQGHLQNAERTVPIEELYYNLQRAQYRRPEDRKRLMRPLYHFGAFDAYKLRGAGIIQADEQNSMLYAAGMSHIHDQELWEKLQSPVPIDQIVMALNRREITDARADELLALAGVINAFTRERILKMRYFPPSPYDIMKAATRYAWNEDLVNMYNLDEGLQENPAARWWIQSQGATKQGAGMPEANADAPDWMRMQWRATRKMPSFTECLHMQWRLRPWQPDSDLSVDEVTRSWTPQDTENILRMEGTPEGIAKQMIASSIPPLDAISMSMLLPAILEHPKLKRFIEDRYGADYKWVDNILLDHGHNQIDAEIMGEAYRLLADDHYNAPKIAHQKALREERRALALDAYEIGTLPADRAVPLMIDTHYTPEMAKEAIDLRADKMRQEIASARVKSLRDAYMSGQIDAKRTRDELGLARINEDRIAQYFTLWGWQRDVDSRQLTTAEIMNALKNGLMTQQQAVQRLTNLGWKDADALIEVQVMQRELMIAQAKMQATAAAKAQAIATRQTREQRLAAAHAKADADKAAAKKAKMTKEEKLAIHQKLMHESEYYAKVHTSNDAYAKAEKKGDEEKQFAELDKQRAAYQDWLIKQIELASEGPTVQREIGPLQTTPAQGPDNRPPTNGTPGQTNPPGH